MVLFINLYYTHFMRYGIPCQAGLASQDPHGQRVTPAPSVRIPPQKRERAMVTPLVCDAVIPHVRQDVRTSWLEPRWPIVTRTRAAPVWSSLGGGPASHGR